MAILPDENVPRTCSRAPPRGLIRPHRLNMTRIGSDTFVQHQAVSRASAQWNQHQKKWGLLAKPNTNTIDAGRVEVIVGDGTLGIEFIMNEATQKVYIKTYHGETGPRYPIHIIRGGELRTGLVVDAINDIEVYIYIDKSHRNNHGKTSSTGHTNTYIYI
jgi:hypothetical protein